MLARRTLATGATSGVVATGAMTLVMALTRRRSWLGTPPPRQIVDEAVPALPSGARRVVAAGAHVGFGATAGSVYASLAARRRGRHAPGAAGGAVFGVLVWAVSYEGWVPLVGLLRPAHRDRAARSASMVAAHVVYGSVLGATLGTVVRRVRRALSSG